MLKKPFRPKEWQVMLLQLNYGMLFEILFHQNSFDLCKLFLCNFSLKSLSFHINIFIDDWNILMTSFNTIEGIYSEVITQRLLSSLNPLTWFKKKDPLLLCNRDMWKKFSVNSLGGINFFHNVSIYLFSLFAIVVVVMWDRFRILEMKIVSSWYI